MSVPAGAYISHDATGQHVQQCHKNSPENVTDSDVAPLLLYFYDMIKMAPYTYG